MVKNVRLVAYSRYVELFSLCGHKVIKKSTRDLPYFFEAFVKPLFWDRIDAQQFNLKVFKNQIAFWPKISTFPNSCGDYF